jgi:hypothetical protein
MIGVQHIGSVKSRSLWPLQPRTTMRASSAASRSRRSSASSRRLLVCSKRSFKASMRSLTARKLDGVVDALGGHHFVFAHRCPCVSRRRYLAGEAIEKICLAPRLEGDGGLRCGGYSMLCPRSAHRS